MGEITREKIISILRQVNAIAREDDLNIYADCFLDYKEAQSNIDKNGNIVAHPRTGSPIDNPYSKVKAAAMNNMRKIVRIKNFGILWD